MKTTLLILTAIVILMMLDDIQVNAKYKQAFAGETICLTEKVSLLDYLKLGTKEGFVKYGH